MKEKLEIQQLSRVVLSPFIDWLSSKTMKISIPIRSSTLFTRLATRPLLWLAISISLLFSIGTMMSHPQVLEKAHPLQHWPLGESILGNVKNQTLGFEKLLVISLPDRSDKRDVWSLAAAASDLSITWVDGVRGEDVPPKAIPAGWNMRESNGTLGCYRSHLNAMQKMINERISTALILEDDADWDITIRSQLTEFARGLHYLQRVDHPRSLHSPYGDDWDLLWFGYCGAKSRSGDHDYYVIHDDPTVPPESVRTETRSGRWLDDSAPMLQGPYTRVITEPWNIRCTYSYAISLRGAQKFVYNYSLMPKARTADVALSQFCGDRVSGAKCFAPYPQLIDNYLAAGDTIKDSDRRLFHSTFREKGMSNNIVFPVKTNLETFITGGHIYNSSWPNETLLPFIDPASIIIPQGTGMYLTKDVFNTREGY